MAQALRAGLRNGGLRRGGLRPGLGNGSLFAIASLDLFFARNRTLDPRVTFTRASSGTYVGSDGLIKTATTNLLLRSEEFGTTWSQYLITSLTSNSTIAPNGTLAGDTVEYSADAFADINQAAAFIVNGLTYTLSVWARAASGTSRFRFKYWNGTAGVYSSAIDISETWQRHTYTFTATATSAGANVGFANTSAATRSVVFWGAQLEQSSTVGEYIPTTSTINSAPRFDHNPTTGESLGLLVEEQRTNLLVQSEDFSTTWTTAELTVTTNQITAPNGAVTADRLAETATTNRHELLQTVSVTSGTSYTISVFAKAAERSGIFFLLGSGGYGANVVAIFDFVAKSATVTIPGTSTSASIQELSNGWFRCVLTSQATATASVIHRVGILGPSSATNYAGDITKGVYIWGAQLEAGAFPTSYIPTTTATVTRSADVASISGSNFSGWYRQDEGTVFAESAAPALNCNIMALSDGTGSNRILLDTGTNTKRFTVTAGGVAQASITRAYTYGAITKCACAFKQDSFQFSDSGTLAVEDTSGTVPTTDRLYIGLNATGLLPLNGAIKRLTYWPQRLANNVLQTIAQ